MFRTHPGAARHPSREGIDAIGGLRSPLERGARLVRRSLGGGGRAGCVTLFLGLATLAFAAPEEPAHWLRYPAISPDGTTLAFAAAGRIWRVPAAGGDAVPLTDGDYYATQPVWSPDGSRLAFAAKRYGNLDVFLVPATGGRTRR